MLINAYGLVLILILVFTFFITPKMIRKFSKTETWSIFPIMFFGELILIFLFNFMFKYVDPSEKNNIFILLVSFMLLIGAIQEIISFQWGLEYIRRLPSLNSKYRKIYIIPAVYFLLLLFVFIFLRKTTIFVVQEELITILFFRIALGASLELLFVFFRKQFYAEELKERFNEIKYQIN